MKNSDLRMEAKTCGVCWWQIADVLGISEPTMTRRLRHEWTQTQKDEIRAIIRRLSKEVKG